ncbi:MAG: isoprenyl transferase [Bacteroidetes bacterium]|nr:isoprenyl transferase [Bacteroidota bacterium]
MTLIDRIDISRLPKHVAIIMDGNGRWAKKQGKERYYGHQVGVQSVKKVAEAAAELGVEYITLYAFSTENWNRPKEEVDAIMALLIDAIAQETPTLMKNNIKLEVIGDIAQMAKENQEALKNVIEKTKDNSRMTMVLALSYSSRWEITNAVKEIALKIANNELKPEDITQETISCHLNTKKYPDPDLLIRTSGEYRISNYLLWQIAYSELYFTNTLWPEFDKESFYEAIIDFQSRERRFGKTSEQVCIK